MALHLRKLGVKRVRPLKGGLNTWREKGYSTEVVADITAFEQPVEIQPHGMRS